MFSYFLKKSITLSSTLILFTSFTNAQEWLDNFQGTWGIGASILNSNYKDADTQTTLAPYIFGAFGKVQIEANRVLYPLYSTPHYTLSATGNYRSQQYSKEFDRDRSLELGLTLDIPLAYGFTSRLTSLSDVSQTHKGHELEALIYRHDSIGNFSILSALGVQYQNDSLANYYYGTNSYQANDGYVLEGEVIATYPINNFALFTGVRSYWYGSNVSNSPIASSANTVLSFAGVGYRF